MAKKKKKKKKISNGVNVPLFKIAWNDSDIKAIKKVIESGKYWATGPQIKEFEKKIANYLNIQYCLTFNSGGSALFSLMKAYNFKKGDEIIVPSFTFIATAFAPLYVGAKPVFADIEEKTFGLDPKDVEKKINKNTKAILPIHYGGTSCQIDKLKAIAKKHNLILIEDTAETFGAKFKNKYLSQFGDSSILSFCQNKIFTTGEGGAIVTNNKEVYKKAKLFRSYGREVKGNYFENGKDIDYVKVGHNIRMSSILAALGISQLENVDKNIKKRREAAKYYNKKLKDLEQIKTPTPLNKDFYNVYQMYTIRVLSGKKTRDNLKKYLEKQNISTKIYFEPVHKYSAFKNYNPKLKNTENLSNQVLSLPIYPDITKKKIHYITEKIKEFYYENK